MAETEPTAQYSDPLQPTLPWCLPHVYSLWAESEHGARLVDIREANGAVGHGPSIQKSTAQPALPNMSQYYDLTSRKVS